MLITESLPNFLDNAGNPLNGGKIYIGVVNQNPETSPVAVYWDAAMTQQAAQPLRTLNGFISHNGTPANIFVAGTHSITVRDSRNMLVYSFLENFIFNSGNISFIQFGAGAVQRTVQSKLRDFVTDFDFGAIGDGVADDTAELISAGATGKNVLLVGTSYNFIGTIAGKFYHLNSSQLSYTGAGRFASLGSYSPLTNQNYSQSGAVIHRFGDKVLIGGAIESDSALPNVDKDWLTEYQNTFVIDGGGINDTLQGASLFYSTVGLNNESSGMAGGGLFAAHSKHFTSAGASCIGMFGMAINDNLTLGTSAWAFYGEAHRMNDAVGGARGMELDVSSWAPLGEIDPFPHQQTLTSCLQLGAGCGLDAVVGGVQNDIGCVIQVVNNPMRFKKGFVFGKQSLVGTDGVSGYGVAMALSSFQGIDWFNTTGSLVGRIAGTNVDSTNKTELRFAALGLQVLGESGQSLAYVFNIAAAVSYPTLSAGVAGNPSIFGCEGAAADIDLQIAPKGAGVVRFGVRSAIAAEIVTGYITIKDASGVSRKLAVVS